MVRTCPLVVFTEAVGAITTARGRAAGCGECVDRPMDTMAADVGVVVAARCVSRGGGVVMVTLSVGGATEARDRERQDQSKDGRAHQCGPSPSRGFVPSVPVYGFTLPRVE